MMEDKVTILQLMQEFYGQPLHRKPPTLEELSFEQLFSLTNKVFKVTCGESPPVLVKIYRPEALPEFTDH